MDKNGKMALIVLSFLCSSCVPLPHFETQRTHVSGTLTRNDAPLSEAALRVSVGGNTDWSCSKAVTVSKTDSNGDFDLEGDKTFRFFRTLIGDPFYVYQLCISVGDKTFLGYMDRGVGYPRESLSLRCKITSDSNPIDENTSISTIHKYMICTPGT